ncbi:hypothetical protein JW964_08890 [candidate division KSB1 bacterium]|nr:hypothetical protein [candidate division KSB1 bacterium]
MTITHRQRMLAAFEFSTPDQIPVVYHPSPAGLYVHGQKLLDLFREYPPDNPIVFEAIATPPTGTVDEYGRYYELKTDEWGTQWEHVIFGIAGHPKGYPFSSWEAARNFQFPPIPEIDLGQITRLKNDYLIFDGWISIFEKLHALRPMDELLIDIFMENPHLLHFLDRLEAYWLECIWNYLSAGIDVICFGDDWGTQSASIISPKMFRKLFKPRYQRMMDLIKKAGKKIFFHSCGYPGELIDDLFELGIDGLWPQIKFFDTDPNLIRKCIDHQVAIYIHPDRQRLIPRGTPTEIERAIRHYADRYHALGGGGIFYVEIENDAPFENVKTLIEAIHKYR